MIKNSIKKGFSLANKNWPLVLIELTVSVIIVITLFVFTLVSVAAAVGILGIDIANMREMFPEMLRHPEGLISKYLSLIFLFLIVVTVYLTVVSCLLLYCFGGKLGVLQNSAADDQYEFRLSSFFKEAKKLFFPYLWLFSIMFPVVLLAVIFIFIGLGAYFVFVFNQPGSMTSVFIASFLALLFVFMGIAGSLGSFIFSSYAAVILADGKKGIISSFKETFIFIKDKPASILFFIAVFSALTVISAVLAIINQLFLMIPVAGILISIPFQFMVSIVSSYLGIVMWSSFIVYYLNYLEERELPRILPSV
jgi:hypothetical protein